jgi:hypothetical protein
MPLLLLLLLLSSRPKQATLTPSRSQLGMPLSHSWFAIIIDRSCMSVTPSFAYVSDIAGARPAHSHGPHQSCQQLRQ